MMFSSPPAASGALDDKEWLNVSFHRRPGQRFEEVVEGGCIDLVHGKGAATIGFAIDAPSRSRQQRPGIKSAPRPPATRNSAID